MKDLKNLQLDQLRLLAFLFAVMLLGGCEEHEEHVAPAVLERDSASVMVTHGVNTLISDSGVMKYRIVTEEMDINQVRVPSKWSFVKGIFLEQFDERFHVEAYIQADTAYYYDTKHLWELRSRVRVRNNKGLVFTSEELFWDERLHELYSHRFSRLVTPERTMQGTYFRSDENMRHYTINNSKGSVQASDITGEEEKPAPADTANQQPIKPKRPAARAKAKTVEM